MPVFVGHIISWRFRRNLFLHILLPVAKNNEMEFSSQWNGTRQLAMTSLAMYFISQLWQVQTCSRTEITTVNDRR